MSSSALLASHSAASTPHATTLGPWLKVGPIETEVALEQKQWRLYDFDRRVGVLPEADERSLGDALARPAREGESLEFLGQRTPWQLLRPPAHQKLALWARNERLPLRFASAYQTLLSGGPTRTELEIRAIGGVRVWLDGRLVYRANWPGGRYTHPLTHTVPVELGEGEHVLSVVVFSTHLQVANGFWVGARSPVTARVNWNDLQGARERLETSFRQLYVQPWFLHDPAQPVLVGVEGEASPLPIEFAATGRNGPLRSELRAGVGEAALALGEEFSRGATTIRSSAVLPSGVRIPGPEFRVECRMLRPLPAASGELADFGARKRHLLSLAASHGRGVPSLLARCALGTAARVTEADFATELAAVRERKDAVDFALNDLIRLHYQFSDRLDPSAKDALRSAFTGFKYWVDEPGPSSMFMKSENHQILFHTLQYLSGLSFPKERFVELDAPGPVQALKGRILASEWIDQRQRHGFDEWMSPGYLEKDALALLNLIDFPNDDNRVQSRATQLLHALFLTLLSHEFEGFLHTTAGRVYPAELLLRESQEVAGIIWLLTGRGYPKITSGSVALALSRYELPEALRELGREPRMLLTRAQQGRLTPAGGANVVTLRTPRYVLSTLVNYQPGALGYQENVAIATLPGGVSVWLNSALADDENARPGFWLGNIEHPRAVQHGALSVVMFRLQSPLAFSHAYFPRARFERVVNAAGWLAAELKGSYIAIYSENPMTAVEVGRHRHTELRCAAPDNTWLLQVGSADGDGSFEDFCRKLPQPRFVRGAVQVADLEMSWTGPVRVNGAPWPTRSFPLIENAVARGHYGVGVIEVEVGGHYLRIAP